MSNESLGNDGPGIERDDGGSTVEMQTHRHSVRQRLVGRRLDRYLHGRYPRISRTALQRFIQQGLSTVNGRPTQPSYDRQPRR